MRRRSATLLIVGSLLTGVAQAETPKTPLSIEGKWEFTADGAVLINASALSGESLAAVEVRVTVDDGDRIAVAPPSRISLTAGRPLPLSLKVMPGMEGNHRIEINLHAERGEAGSWGDQYSFFYHSSGDRLSPEWKLREPIGKIEGERGGDEPLGRAASKLQPGPLAPAEPAAPSAPLAGQNDGTVTVTGYWYMYDKYGTAIPQIERIVELRDRFENVLATTNTNLQGYYSFPAVANPGSLKTTVYARTRYNRSGGVDEVRMRTKDGGYYYTDSGLQNNVPDGNYYMGVWYTPHGDLYEPAYWAFNSIQDTWRYFFFLVPNTYAGTIQAVWYPGSTESTRYSHNGFIYLDDNDPKSPHEVAHEAGHNAMNTAYDGNWPLNDCPSPHLIDGVSGIFCGWTEGWADWVSAAVTNNPIYWDADNWSVNFETRYGFASGDQVEGNVAAAMWDIMDSANEGNGDFYTDSAGPFWNTVWDNNVGIFCAFWNQTRNYNVKRSRDNCLNLATITQCNTCIEDPYEDDDSCQTGTNEAVPSIYTYEHCTDVDWQYANVQRDWVYVWDTDDLGYSGDTVLELWSGDCGSKLTEADDRNSGNFPRSTHMEWKSDRDGTVRVKAAEYNGYGAHKSYDIALNRYCPDSPAVSNMSPDSSAPVCGPTVRLTWQSSATQYQVVFDGSYFLPCNGTYDTSCTVNNVGPGQHWFQVVSLLKCGSQSVSAQSYFTVLDAGSAATTPIELSLSGSTISWNAIPDALSYDAVSGDLGTLESTLGDFSQATQSCVASRQAATIITDPAQPDPGAGSYYLVRGRGCAAVGSYDDLSDSQLGSRDAPIAASPGACP